MIPIGLIMGAAGTIGQLSTQAQQNKRIKDIMAKMKAPGTEGLQQAQSDLAQAKLIENAQMPGTQEYLSSIERGRSSQIAAAERAGENTLLASAAAGGKAAEEASGLAQQQAQYKLQARQQGLAASQGYQQALANQQQQYNDYLQSLISGESSLGQGQAAAFGGLANLGGGIMANTAYAKSQNKDFKGWKFLGTHWG